MLIIVAKVLVDHRASGSSIKDEYDLDDFVLRGVISGNDSPELGIIVLLQVLMCIRRVSEMSKIRHQVQIV